MSQVQVGLWTLRDKVSSISDRKEDLALRNSDLSPLRLPVKFVNALLDEIDFRLGLSEADIVTASSAYPVHGLLQALQ